MTTVALPLSAGSIVMSLFLFRFLRALCSVELRFGLGGLVVLKILDTSCLICSEVWSSSVDILDSMFGRSTMDDHTSCGSLIEDVWLNILQSSANNREWELLKTNFTSFIN